MSKKGTYILQPSAFSFQLSALCLLLLISSCIRSADPNRLLAKVYSKELRLTDMEGMFPENATAEDSTLKINAYVDRWIHDNLMMHEAERNIPKDLNVEELVNHYRESLILSNYEKILTETSLDSSITDAELNSFYEKNKEQYQLDAPIARCNFMKVPKGAPLPDSLQKWWNNAKTPEAKKKLVDYSIKYAKTYMLADSVWRSVDDIVGYLPKGTLTAENVSAGKELTLKDNDYQYYLRILGTVSQKEIAPLDFIKNQASKFILHNRKLDLLDKKKQEMYDSEMRRNNVKIYTY